VPLILSWYWTEHCKKYWKGSEEARCERHSFVCPDEVGTVKTDRAKKDEECRGGLLISPRNKRWSDQTRRKHNLDGRL
jgi:hypothetical protein